MEDRKSIHTYIVSNLVLLVPSLFLLVRTLQTKKYFWQLEAALTGNVVWYCTEVCLILLWKQDSLLPSKFRGFTSKHEWYFPWQLTQIVHPIHLPSRCSSLRCFTALDRWYYLPRVHLCCCFHDPCVFSLTCNERSNSTRIYSGRPAEKLESLHQYAQEDKPCDFS